MICRDTPTHGWICGWMGSIVGQWIGLGHITKYRINIDLIEIIQFCLKTYDLLRHPKLWVGGWVVQWVDGWFSGSMGRVRSYY